MDQRDLVEILAGRKSLVEASYSSGGAANVGQPALWTGRQERLAQNWRDVLVKLEALFLDVLDADENVYGECLPILKDVRTADGESCWECLPRFRTLLEILTRQQGDHWARYAVHMQELVSDMEWMCDQLAPKDDLVPEKPPKEKEDWQADQDADIAGLPKPTKSFKPANESMTGRPALPPFCPSLVMASLGRARNLSEASGKVDLSSAGDAIRLAVEAYTDADRAEVTVQDGRFQLVCEWSSGVRAVAEFGPERFDKATSDQEVAEWAYDALVESVDPRETWNEARVVPTLYSLIDRYHGGEPIARFHFDEVVASLTSRVGLHESVRLSEGKLNVQFTESVETLYGYFWDWEQRYGKPFPGKASEGGLEEEITVERWESGHLLVNLESRSVSIVGMDGEEEELDRTTTDEDATARLLSISTQRESRVINPAPWADNFRASLIETDVFEGRGPIAPPSYQGESAPKLPSNYDPTKPETEPKVWYWSSLDVAWKQANHQNVIKRGAIMVYYDLKKEGYEVAMGKKPTKQGKKKYGESFEAKTPIWEDQFREELEAIEEATAMSFDPAKHPRDGDGQFVKTSNATPSQKGKATRASNLRKLSAEKKKRLKKKRKKKPRGKKAKQAATDAVEQPADASTGKVNPRGFAGHNNPERDDSAPGAAPEPENIPSGNVPDTQPDAAQDQAPASEPPAEPSAAPEADIPAEPPKGVEAPEPQAGQATPPEQAPGQSFEPVGPAPDAYQPKTKPDAPKLPPKPSKSDVSAYEPEVDQEFGQKEQEPTPPKRPEVPDAPGAPVDITGTPPEQEAGDEAPQASFVSPDAAPYADTSIQQAQPPKGFEDIIEPVTPNFVQKYRRPPEDIANTTDEDFSQIRNYIYNQAQQALAGDQADPGVQEVLKQAHHDVEELLHSMRDEAAKAGEEFAGLTDEDYEGAVRGKMRDRLEAEVDRLMKAKSEQPEADKAAAAERDQKRADMWEKILGHVGSFAGFTWDIMKDIYNRYIGGAGY